MEKIHIVPDDAPCLPNQTIFQGFEWYLPATHQHWIHLTNSLPQLALLGITSLWIPPASKGAAGPNSNGYDVYDLYDLGEFNQHGARHTKYGTKEELVKLVDAANSHGIRILFDAVLNHRIGADHSEPCIAVKVDPHGISPPHLPQATVIHELSRAEIFVAVGRQNQNDQQAAENRKLDKV